jgi:hypothetical protein
LHVRQRQGCKLKKPKARSRPHLPNRRFSPLGPAASRDLGGRDRRAVIAAALVLSFFAGAIIIFGSSSSETE